MKSLVVLSGGMDSATVLYEAVRSFREVGAISFNYGSKHNRRELECASKLAALVNVDHEVIKLPLGDYFTSNLLKGGGDIPYGHYEDDNMAKTVVPFRNGIMLSFAAGYAESCGYDEILLGSHKGDHAQYPDCRYEFTQAMNLAVYLGTGSKVRVRSPFNNKTKAEIVAVGLDIGVPFQHTWSCYEGGDRPNYKTSTMVERTEAFLECGIRDPALTPTEWESAVTYFREAKAQFEEKS